MGPSRRCKHSNVFCTRSSHMTEEGDKDPPCPPQLGLYFVTCRAIKSLFCEERAQFAKLNAVRIWIGEGWRTIFHSGLIGRVTMQMCFPRRLKYDCWRRLLHSTIKLLFFLQDYALTLQGQRGQKKDLTSHGRLPVLTIFLHCKKRRKLKGLLPLYYLVA